MASSQTLGPVCRLISATSGAVQVGASTDAQPQAWLLQNQSSITVYLGPSGTVATSAAVQIAAGASFNPDKHQTPRTDRQAYGLDWYYVSTRSTTAATLALLYHEILQR